MYAMMGFKWTVTKFLLVYLLYVLHTAVLRILWHDGDWDDTEPHRSFHCIRRVPRHMEPLLRFFDPPNGKLALVLIAF